MRPVHISRPLDGLRAARCGSPEDTSLSIILSCNPANFSPHVVDSVPEIKKLCSLLFSSPGYKFGLPLSGLIVEMFIFLTYVYGDYMK